MDKVDVAESYDHPPEERRSHRNCYGMEPECCKAADNEMKSALTYLGMDPPGNLSDSIPRLIKASDIPVVEMFRLMKTYGPESCGRYYSIGDCPPATDEGRKALRKKFYRWFPSFRTNFALNAKTLQFEPRFVSVREEQARRLAGRLAAREKWRTRVATSLAAVKKT